MARVLYSGTKNASSWAFRAWLALKEQNIDFEEEVIDIRVPQRWENLSRIGQFSPPAAVPVLDDHGEIIYDSLAIMEYANELGGNTLLPSDIKHRARTRAFVAWQHSTLGQICPRFSFESAFYPNKRQPTMDEVSGAEFMYSVWEKELAHYQGEYLMGEYSLADIALVPSVLRLTTHIPVAEQFPLTAQWIERLIARPLIQEWLEEAYKLPPIYFNSYVKGSTE